MVRTLVAAVLIALCLGRPALAQGEAPGPEDPPGARFKLSDGQLFVPETFKPDGEPVPLLLHLHGAFGTMEQNHVRANQPGVLVSVVLPGLSAVYRERFKEPATFTRILDETTAKLRERFGKPEMRVGEVTLTSFSAGFGGVRELLSQPAAFDRIGALVMADSLYAGFTGDPQQRQVEPAHMEGFLRFAKEAVAGKKRFVLSHCQLHTPNYASTVDTADYLLKELGGEREPAKESWAGGLELTGKWKKGRFELLTFTGETGQDHMKHLRQIAVFIERAR